MERQTGKRIDRHTDSDRELEILTGRQADRQTVMRERQTDG